MEAEISPQPPATAPQQPTIPPAPEKNSSLKIHWLLILVLVCVSSYFGYQNWQLNQQITKNQPTPTITPTPTPPYVLTVIPTTGKSLYTNNVAGFSMEFPQDWKINQYGALIKDFSPDSETSLQCGKKGLAQLSLDTNNNFRENPAWSKLFSIDNFYNLDNPSWKGFFKSGGGGINSDTLSLTTVGKQKAIKFTRIWTDVIECWPKTEIHYFILNPTKSMDNFYVIHIEYEIISGDSSASQIGTAISQILSTFKFTNTASPTSSPTPSAVKIIPFILPSGWSTAADPSGYVSVGFNPQTMKISKDGNILTRLILRPDPTLGYTSDSSIGVYPYNGGSRHQFIYDNFNNGRAIGSDEKYSDYNEIPCQISGKQCLMLDGITISQFPNVVGMCDIGGGRGLLVTSYDRKNYESMLQTITILR